MKPIKKIMLSLSASRRGNEMITKIIMDGVFYQRLLSECSSDISKIHLLNTHTDEFMGLPIELKDIDVDFKIITAEDPLSIQKRASKSASPTHPNIYDCNASNCRAESFLDMMGSSVDSYEAWEKSRLGYKGQ